MPATAGTSGLMAKNLATGETVSYNATDRFPTASTIKLPVMAAYFDLVRRKEIDPETRITLRTGDRKPGSGVLQFMEEGAVITLRDAVTLMITMSDNTATNLVLDRLAPTHRGEAREGQRFSRVAGSEEYPHTQSALYARDKAGDSRRRCATGWAYRRRRTWSSSWSGSITGPSADSASCAAMIGILENQFYNDMVPRLLPQGEPAPRLRSRTKPGASLKPKPTSPLLLQTG
jgi:beta-lactamase class A